MQKKLYSIIINALIFIVFSYFMPGFVIAYGPIGRILLGLGYGVIYKFTPSVMRFFRIPKTLLFRSIVTTILVMLYLFLLNTQVSRFLLLGRGYIGGINFILFYSPVIFILDTQILMIFISSITLFVCSIMFEKLKK